MKRKVLYILLGLMLTINGLSQPILSSIGSMSFCEGVDTTKLKVTSTIGVWVQFEYAPIGTEDWQIFSAPIQVTAGNSFYNNIFYYVSYKYRIQYDNAGTMSGKQVLPTTLTSIVNPLPTITTTGILSPLCYSTSIQTSTLSYTGTTNSPTSYSVLWDASANIAGLGNQTSTTTSFSSSGGIVSTFNISSSLAAGSYNGIVKISNANGCSNTNSISVTVNPLPTITTTGILSSLCYSTSAQTATLSYTATTYSPNSYSIDWVSLTDKSITSNTFNSGVGNLNDISVNGAVASGTYSGTLKIYNDNGCSNSILISLVVDTLPIVKFDVAPNLQECQNSSLTYITQSGQSGYSWIPSGTLDIDYKIDSGDLSASSYAVKLKWLTSGVKIVQLNYLDGHSCTAVSPTSTSTTINGLPTITTNGILKEKCYSTSIQSTILNYSSTTNAPTSYTIDWNAVANTAGLSDQSTTVKIFGAGAGNVNNISLSSSLAAGTYTGTMVIKNGNNCTNSQALNIVINGLPLANDITTPNTSVCVDTTIELSANPLGGSGLDSLFEWGGITYSDGSAVVTSYPIVIPGTGSIAGTYNINYRVMDTKGCISLTSNDIVITVNALPLAPIVMDTAYCKNITSVALNADSLVNHRLNWYGTNATSGVSTSIAPIPTTSSVAVNNYYVSQTNTATSCESPRASIKVTIKTLPLAPLVRDTAYCKDASVVALTATNLTSHTLGWYGISATGGTLSSTASRALTTTVGDVSYYVSQTNTATTCESPRAAIKVTIKTLPFAPLVRDTAYCKDASVVALTATNLTSHTLGWYGISAIGGTYSSTAPKALTTIVGDLSYYVSQTNTATSCESPRAAIKVTVNALPLAPVVRDTAYCKDASVVALTATYLTNHALGWYGTSATGGTYSSTAPTALTNTVGDLSYYVSQTNTATSCESPRVAIKVTVNALPIAPIITNMTHEYDGSIHAGDASLSSLALTTDEIKWYTSSTGLSIGAAPKRKIVGNDTTYAEVINSITTCKTANREIVKVEITKAPLTITGLSGLDKVYNGTISATASGTAVYSGLVTGESFIVTGIPNYVFTDSLVGISKPIIVSGFDVPSGNYSITQPSLSANINTKELTVTGLIGANKIYDGTKVATVTGLAQLTGVIDADTANVKLGGTAVYTFDSKNVANAIAINTTGFTKIGTASSNYTFTQPTLSANITAKSLTISGTVVSNKEYDGTTTTSITPGSLVGVISPDVVLLTQLAAFTDKKAGIIKAMNWFNTLSGADAMNYVVSQPNISGTITPKLITFSGAITANKIYDGNSKATISGGALVGVVTPDVVNLIQSGNFPDKNAGTNKAITSTSKIVGADSANYTLIQPTLLARDIIPKSLTITADNKTKEYGRPNPLFTLSYNGFVTGESVSNLATLPQVKVDADASTSVGDYYIIPSGATASNYSFVYRNGILSIILPPKNNFEVPNAFMPRSNIYSNSALRILHNGGVPRIDFFKIYNRMGMLIKSFNNIDDSWDGTFNGAMQEADVYVWVAKYYELGSTTGISKTGQFLLIK